MADRTEICAFLKAYLEVQNFEDGCINGMQVEGSPIVTKIITGVSINQELIDEAIAQGAQMIIVHHGLFYGKGAMSIEGVLKQRLEKLLTHNISLLGFHLPLDYHQEVGNGPELLAALGCHQLEQRAGEWVGTFPKPISKEHFQELVTQKISPQPFPVLAGTDEISTVMAVTGAAPRYVSKAIDSGCDAFLTGEVKEDVVDLVKESQMNFIAAGHYNTEVFGVQALKRVLEKQFDDVSVEFFPVPNRA